MKNLILIIIIAFLYSCTANEKDDLIGSWFFRNELYGGTVEFQFLNDSVFIYDGLGIKSGSWEADKEKIYVTDINGPFVELNQMTYLYQLDQSKKLLNLKAIRDSVIQLPEFTKAESAHDYFQKSIDLEIQLPEISTKIGNTSRPTKLDFNIYAGFNNNKLVVKTDLSSDLNDLNNEVDNFIANKREELKPALRLNLIADKNLSKSQLDSVKIELRKSSIDTIVRTYVNKQSDNKHYLDWFVQNE